MTSLEAKVINIQKDVDEIKTLTAEKRPFKEFEEILPLNKFSETHELTFPLKTMDEFISFEEELVNGAFKDLNH
ncbi:hypothetical protein TSAR_014620 [Trichomalopsis sarcophagae]|uniref:Uncharacterized protein n=1 Tax=Trichomalopsis sarcophagae TaxID=543379 RepID=A0A232EH11_9HYME|nr:hypothetical protein TSAR_014620 [Trichomalopsis sarcophagae]